MEDHRTRIGQLASIISTRTSEIEEYTLSNNLPEPSFLPSDGKPDPPNIQAARAQVVEASAELRELMLGPQAFIMQNSGWPVAALGVISRFDLAQKVPTEPGSSISYAELAQLAGMNEDVLTRTLRFAAANRIFREEPPSSPGQPGRVSHSAASHLIATNENMRLWIGTLLGEILPPALCFADAIERFPDASEPTQTAAAIAFGTANKATFYEVVNGDPVRSKRFAGAMSMLAKSSEADIRVLTSGYDWTSLPDGSTVVDVGGSHGEAARAVATIRPKLKFVVQDLPAVIKKAPELPNDSNIEFMAHDFLTPQPIHGAEMYLFRWIFHNWSTPYCLRILRALIPALTPGAKILVNDRIMPDVGSVPNSAERRARGMDLAMMQLGNSKDRDAREWEELFREADERFAFRWVKYSEGGGLSLMEAEWKG